MRRLYIANGSDAARMATLLLEAADPAAGLDKNASIALKPNLVVAKGWKSGATTNPAVCAAAIEYFLDRGYKNISIIEGSWLATDTRHAFRVCGYEELAKKYGIELIDTKSDKCETREFGGMKIEISKRALETDFIVNLPLIKGHCQTEVTCALKNMKGVIPDKEKRRFHSMGLHKPIAYLNKMIYPSFTLADGTWADPGFEEGGNPVRMDTMIAGNDSVLIDAYAAKTLGLRPRDIGYIRIAEEIGIGSADIDSAEIIRVTGETDATTAAKPKNIEDLKQHIVENDACSECCSNLLSALTKLEPEKREGLKVCVGQGFKGQTGEIGCGDCTQGFRNSIKGCPPDTEYIIEELTALGRK